jgi:NADPH-dependent curcumin reductase CurA
MGKSLRLEGFNIANYFDHMPEFQREMSGWIHEGKITWKETIEHGIENAPGLFNAIYWKRMARSDLRPPRAAA